jgi:DNA-binding MarR family transcriptional regulator
MNNEQMIKFRTKIRKLEREIEQQTEYQGKCCGVTLAQCHAILELEQLGKTSIKDLAQYLDLDKSTLSRTVDSLVQDGLVDRVINEEDRRYMDINLSKKGREMCKNINKECNDFYNKLFAEIPKEKHESVLEGISLFIDAMYKTKSEFITCCNNKSRS